MLSTQHITRTLLLASLAGILTIATSQAFGGEDLPKTYLDPISGEVKELDKLPSEMTADELKQLTPEELQTLQEVEAKIRAGIDVSQ